MERLLTIQETAEALRMSERWVGQKMADKELVYIKFGNIVRIPESEVLKFIESKKVGA